MILLNDQFFKGKIMFRFIWKSIKTAVILTTIIILLVIAGIGYSYLIEPNRLNTTEISDISYSIKNL